MPLPSGEDLPELIISVEQTVPQISTRRRLQNREAQRRFRERAITRATVKSPALPDMYPQQQEQLIQQKRKLLQQQQPPPPTPRRQQHLQQQQRQTTTTPTTPTNPFDLVAANECDPDKSQQLAVSLNFNDANSAGLPFSASFPVSSVGLREPDLEALTNSAEWYGGLDQSITLGMSHGLIGTPSPYPSSSSRPPGDASAAAGIVDLPWSSRSHATLDHAHLSGCATPASSRSSDAATPLSFSGVQSFSGHPRKLSTPSITLRNTNSQKNSPPHYDGAFEQDGVIDEGGNSSSSRSSSGSSSSSSRLPLLHLATASRNHAVMRVLLRRRTGIVNERDSQGRTALHLAIELGDDELVRFLLQQGADPRLEDDSGADALHYAVRRGISTLVETLLDTLDVVRNSVPSQRL